MTEVETRLASLAATSKELNDVSDALTASIRSVEERLAALKLGIVARMPTYFHYQIQNVEFPGAYQGDIDPDSPYDYSETDTPFVEAHAYFLEYGRHGDGWRILVRRSLTPYDVIANRELDISDFELNDDVDVVTTLTALLDCSREIRVAAAPFIADLIRAIEDGARAKLELLRDAIVSTEATSSVGHAQARPTSSAGSPPARKRTTKQA